MGEEEERVLNRVDSSTDPPTFDWVEFSSSEGQTKWKIQTNGGSKEVKEETKKVERIVPIIFNGREGQVSVPREGTKSFPVRKQGIRGIEVEGGERKGFKWHFILSHKDCSSGNSRDGQDGGGLLRVRRVHADRGAEQEGLSRDVTPDCLLDCAQHYLSPIQTLTN